MGSMQRMNLARLTIVAGKGGVGKTTVTAALAKAAFDAGLRVLAVDIDDKPALHDLLADCGVEVLTLTAAEALAAYLDEHGFSRVAKRLAATGIIDVVATAAPGIDDLVVLGKIKQLERSGRFDLVVVDGPAAGRANAFLNAPRSLLDAVRGGPIRTQAEDVLSMFADPQRCQALLVTIPETTPVNELLETVETLRETVRLGVAGVVLNGVDTGPTVPDPTLIDAAIRLPSSIRDAALFRRDRQARQHRQIDRLHSHLDVGISILPQLAVAGIGRDDLAQLSRMLDALVTP